MKAKHTPGPWEHLSVQVTRNGETRPEVAIVSRGVESGWKTVFPLGESPTMPLADIRLIAAAPDLHAALASVYAACQTTDYRDPLAHAAIADICRAALARANGGES